MPIALFRIDDRLVHGQVVEGWLPHLKAVEVVVVSDAAAKDETQSLLMRIALPDEVGLKVLRVDEAVPYLDSCSAAAHRVLVLAPGPRQILGLLERGMRMETVNVGGMHYSAGKVQLGKAIFLSDEDKQALSEIGRRGVRLEGRAVPGEPEADLLELLGGGR
ncbi:MAG: PTS sugar transporter subunit IIB [Elusimicrobiota bacterium]|jgi:mannose/fructose/N-acetylgalactosamine-specific phosphotransferase system component IIB